MFDFRETKIEGCFEITGKTFEDERGGFRKLFSAGNAQMEKLGFREIYTSTSKAGVIRGLHFQTPPHDHAKLVACLEGQVFDVVLDLRAKSRTYGEHGCFELSDSKNNSLLIPKGCAHGFYSLKEPALMFYAVETIHAPEHDKGILWNSAGIQWPGSSPIVSKRDAGFPSLQDFKSPF